MVLGLIFFTKQMTGFQLRMYDRSKQELSVID